MTISICLTRYAVGSRFTLASFGRLFSRCSAWNFNLSVANCINFAKSSKGARFLTPNDLGSHDKLPGWSRNLEGNIVAAFSRKDWKRSNQLRDEFSAYGQACLEMAGGIFQLLGQHRAVLFAVAIPPIRPPRGFLFEDYLRKDQVFLLERYFYFLEEKREHGLLVADEVEKVADRAFVRRLESYFTKTMSGRYRAEWIVPTPFFIASDMIYAMQAADLCIYCVNWGFRIPSRGMDAQTRTEVAEQFGPWLNRLQYRGQGYRDGTVFDSYGISFVPNPYGPGRA